MDVTQSSGLLRMARVALPLIAVIALGAGGGPAAAAPGDGFQGENATSGPGRPRRRSLAELAPAHTRHEPGCEGEVESLRHPALADQGGPLSRDRPAGGPGGRRAYVDRREQRPPRTDGRGDRRSRARRRGADRRGPGGAPAPALRRPRGGARRPDRGGREARKGRLCHLLARPLRPISRGAEGCRPRTRCAQRRRRPGSTPAR